MLRFRLVLLAAAALPLGVAGPALAQPTSATASASAQSEHDKLFALFDAADEASLSRNPLSALSRGDMRYADRIGDYYSDAFTNAQRQAAEEELAALAKIDRAALNPTDRIAYDVFEYDRKETLKSLAPDVLALTQVRPINHFEGLHTFYPAIASGQGMAPFRTVADYENNLKRHAEYAKLIDRTIGRFREGMASGVVETKLTVGNMIEQLNTQLAQPVDESPYWGPVGMFPDSFSAADKARLAAEYRNTLAGTVYPANRRLRDFLRDEYLPVARDSVGLSQMKDGEQLYRQMIEQTTTLPLEPAYLHDLGLSEVARIRSQMEKIKQQVGFEGSLKDFFEFIRTDPQFKPQTRGQLAEDYYAIGKAVEAHVLHYFAHTPKSPLEIRAVEPFREKFEAGGSYQSGTVDGSRPGIFYYNAYDLPSRTTPGQTSLYLHEGAPGHHFQISLAQENEALPAFMRFGGNTAYVEGWALYAETLGYPMGLYEDPYQHFGTLNDEMLRAMRLVVDTGLHSKGWGRDQAIEYMLDNSGMGRTDATAEVERYIAIPSQALAYKVGALKIQELRQRAETALGPKFDIREFHDQVLGTGALPLPVLERKIDGWIASKA